MSEGILFALSNNSLDIYPGNTRSSYTNRLPATISVSKIGVKGLWLSLESLAIENSIIPYKNQKKPILLRMTKKAFHTRNSKVTKKSLYLKDGLKTLELL